MSFLNHFSALLSLQGRTNILTPDGEIIEYHSKKNTRLLLCINAPFLMHSMGQKGYLRQDNIFDIAELYAFILPLKVPLPTLSAILETLDLPPHPSSPLETYYNIVKTLLAKIHTLSDIKYQRFVSRTLLSAEAGWNWAKIILNYLDCDNNNNLHANKYDVFAVWERIIDRKERITRYYPDNNPIHPQKASDYLKDILGTHGEIRPEQSEYSATIAQAFTTPLEQTKPILCEAETGTGKTIGYLAPALLWAEKNNRPITISTYSKALQNQVAQELRRFFPHPQDYDQKVTIRKGRENYLCLRSFQNYVLNPNLSSYEKIYALFVSGWADETKIGDLTDGIFPAWLGDMFAGTYTGQFTVSTGECSYSACHFYRKCFAESAADRTQNALAIITNHAFLMSKAAIGTTESAFTGAIILDEAHHLFDAADNAYAFRFSHKTIHDLRLRIFGHKKIADSSLGAKLDTLIANISDSDFSTQLTDKLYSFLESADNLPAPTLPDSLPDFLEEDNNIFTKFFISLMALTPKNSDGYQTEIPFHDLPLADVRPIITPLYGVIQEMTEGLRDFCGTIKAYIAHDDRPTDILRKLDNFLNMIHHTLVYPLDSIHNILSVLTGEIEAKKYAYYLTTTMQGAVLERKLIQPLEQFSEQILNMTERHIFTSASLRDHNSVDNSGWEIAESRTGLSFYPTPAIRRYFKSSFDYANHARIFILNDVSKNHLDRTAEAYLKLIMASGGGALALFTAIRRLKECYIRIAPSLHKNGLDNFAMHFNMADPHTLIDLFRHNKNSVLFGTDLLRDGIDISGDSLRLVLYDRTPWPRPDYVHKLRRNVFGGYGYDKMLVRFKLKQAFGRLIRRQTDKGCFVLTDRETPTEICDAFPKECPIIRISLHEACDAIKEFLGKDGTSP